MYYMGGVSGGCIWGMLYSRSGYAVCGVWCSWRCRGLEGLDSEGGRSERIPGLSLFRQGLGCYMAYCCGYTSLASWASLMLNLYDDLSVDRSLRYTFNLHFHIFLRPAFACRDCNVTAWLFHCS